MTIPASDDPTQAAKPATSPDADRVTAGGALLKRLRAVGVDYIFVNSGTDFPPIIEGFAQMRATGQSLPTPVIVPHESAAMGMAHGFYLATRRSQAVMLHTNVGLANATIGAINAACERIPTLMFSGRTPSTEGGRFGSRTVPIGWGQEMRDQAAMVREATKWDYELRFPEQTAQIVDRAYAVANSVPRGPVYLSLPREVLCEPCTADGLDSPLSMTPSRISYEPASLQAAVRLLSQARKPIIIAQRGAGTADGFAALSRLAEQWAIPVCQYWGLQLAIPGSHPMAAPDNPSALLADADVALIIDALAPWSPDQHPINPACKLIHLGQDPLYTRFPVRNFRCDVALACDTADGIIALEAELNQTQPGAGIDLARRRSELMAANEGYREATRRNAERGCRPAMTREWVSLCLSEVIRGKQATVFSELGCPLAPMTLDHHQAWFQEPHSGGLGWSFPAAMGMQLADRDRLVVATMGDGSYMFANPVACHQIAESLQLPVLVLIINNARWGAVQQSVLGLYPDGAAANSEQVPLTGLSPVPDFTLVAAASRAYARRVEHGEQLRQALLDAIEHIETTRTMALLDIQVA